MVAVVVDVLSFTTTVTAAVDRGCQVIPCRWRDRRAAALATAQGAVLAVGRLEAARIDLPGVASLSPVSMTALRAGTAVVLPSPNGSTITVELAARHTVLAGCLRNAAAVADHLARLRPDCVVVIAAGERWEREQLRPCLEDLWGAGAILDALRQAAPELRLSPEAEAAAAAFDTVRHRLPQLLPTIASGQELLEAGFGSDVEYAAQLNASAAVPVLVDGRFQAAP